MSKPDECHENRKQTHELKTWPVYWQAVARGEKTFELRKNDRDFCYGDKVILKEYDLATKSYTGSELDFEISYILNLGKYFNELEVMQHVIIGFKEITRLYRNVT